MNRWFPPLPPFDQVHPLVVHFPIALLITAPALIVLGLIVRPWARGLYAGGLVMVVLGTIGAWVALSSGSAAERAVIGSQALEDVLHRHEELANSATAWFIGCTLGLGVLLGAGWKWGAKPGGRLPRWVCVAAMLAYLLAHAWGVSLLSRAGHEGGRLVHELGVRAGAAMPGMDDGEP